MPEVFTSAVVGAPAGEVWALLRDFAAIGDWHPALPPSVIGNGPAVRAVTIGNCAYVEWWSRFDCDEPDEDKTTAQIRDGVLVPGMRALGDRFGIAEQAPGAT